mmetsp:Transcript_19032/g.29188  ORF Transcript_19032/g.29188 Transcript_19032/m.29188 type:complete len:80 (-) Transcript_19032:496-735(-)
MDLLPEKIQKLSPVRSVTPVLRIEETLPDEFPVYEHIYEVEMAYYPFCCISAIQIFGLPIEGSKRVTLKVVKDPMLNGT